MSPLSLPTFFSSLSVCSPRIEKIKDGTPIALRSWMSPRQVLEYINFLKKYNIIIISTLLVVFLPLFVTVHFCAKQRTRVPRCFAVPLPSCVVVRSCYVVVLFFVTTVIFFLFTISCVHIIIVYHSRYHYY